MLSSGTIDVMYVLNLSFGVMCVYFFSSFIKFDCVVSVSDYVIVWQGIGCDGCVAARGWIFGVMEYFGIFVS